MKKLSLIFAVLMILLASLTACQKPLKKIEIKDFQNENGVFAYSTLSWGMSKSEVEEALGVRLNKSPDPIIGENGLVNGYYTDADITFLSRAGPATMTYTFNDGELIIVTCTFKYTDKKSAELFYSEITDNLISEFGEPIDTYSNPDAHLPGETEVTISTEKGIWRELPEDGEQSALYCSFHAVTQEGREDEITIILEAALFPPPY